MPIQLSHGWLTSKPTSCSHGTLATFEDYRQKQVWCIDVAILKEITKRTGIEFKYRSCPWARCVKMLENGEVDIIYKPRVVERRAESIEFIEPPVWDGFKVFFYTVGIEIKSYTDLKKRSIGVIHGAAYFSRFDEDRNLTKFAVTEESQLIKMLLAGRIDVIPGIESNFDYMIQERGLSGKLRKSSFAVMDPNPSYIGMSKKIQVHHSAATAE